MVLRGLIYISNSLKSHFFGQHMCRHLNSGILVCRHFTTFLMSAPRIPGPERVHGQLLTWLLYFVVDIYHIPEQMCMFCEVRNGTLKPLGVEVVVPIIIVAII